MTLIEGRSNNVSAILHRQCKCGLVIYVIDKRKV
jgi:hypothetical protein